MSVSKMRGLGLQANGPFWADFRSSQNLISEMVSEHSTAKVITDHSWHRLYSYRIESTGLALDAFND